MLKHIPYLLTVWMLCALASCSNDEELVQEYIPVQVGFTLSTGSNYGTRAFHPDQGETEGTGYENYIDIVNRDFRFYIFNADNTFLEEFKVMMVTPLGNSEYPSTYYVLGELKNAPPEKFKVVVIAHWDNYPSSDKLEVGKTTIEELCEGSDYDYVQPFVPSAEQKIPLYGVRTYQDKTFRPNFCTNLEEINMLRAMAKVTVKIGDDVNYTLTDARVNRFAGHGMAAPIGIYDNTGNECAAWKDGLHVDHAHTINSGSTAFPIHSEDGKEYTIYLPEYVNVDSDYPSYITVTLSNGISYDIYFRNYIDGKPTDTRMDIVRNHYYQFTINKVGAGISVVYEVADWIHEEDKHHWEQDYSYPTYENVFPWEYVVENKFNEKITVLPTMYYVASNFIDDDDDDGSYTIVDDVKGAFTVGFRMVGPAGQKWRPAFHGTEVDYHFRIYRWENNGTLTHLPDENDWIASDNWYQIKLFPGKTAENKTNHVVEFGVATTLAWAGDQSLFLLINGQDAQTLRWPKEWAGTDSRIIRVTQIAAPQQADDNATDEGNE